jgi:hypothetical protein
VAALLGSFADVWYLAGGTVVASADDAWADFELPLPEDAVNLGMTKRLSLEALFSAQPDFILASANTQLHLDWMETLDAANIPTAYFDVSDFVYFIKELHINNYIELQTVQNTDKGNELVDDSLMLYDRDIYEYKNDVDEFWTKGNETQFMGEKYTMKAHVNIKHKSIVYLDIVQTLNKYANAIIYPLPRLIDYVENGYKTIEQRRFEWQKKLTWISIFVAIAIGVLSPIITLCLSNRVEQNFDNNLKGAEKVVESDSSTQTVHFVQFDTLDIKVLAPRTQLKLGINSNQ